MFFFLVWFPKTLNPNILPNKIQKGSPTTKPSRLFKKKYEKISLQKNLHPNFKNKSCSPKNHSQKTLNKQNPPTKMLGPFMSSTKVSGACGTAGCSEASLVASFETPVRVHRLRVGVDLTKAVYNRGTRWRFNVEFLLDDDVWPTKMHSKLYMLHVCSNYIVFFEMDCLKSFRGIMWSCTKTGFFGMLKSEQ